jgi:small subunit ribosomal protein S17
MSEEMTAENTAKNAEKTMRHHQEKVGIVTSAKMQKSIVVEVRRRVPHPVYKRTVTKRSKFMAHDEHSKAKEGDMVRIVETRPLSKSKRWVLKEVIRAAAIAAPVA